LANPSYAYGEDGVYNVSLSATNTCGTTIFEQTITISTPPTAGFSYSGASGCTPYSVTFTNTSSSNATSLLWDFSGGDPATSTADNPMVVWNTAGVYTVTLTATNASGNSTSTAVITVAAQSTSAFDYQLAGLTATFDNMSSNGTDYSWDFGDGSDPSMEENPIHTYGQPGTYTVVLTVTGECGTVTATQTIEIVGTAPTPAISAENGCIPFEAQFMDESEGDPTAWDWTFEGGTPATSTNQNPLVNYAAPGMYDVTLEVTNIFGSNSTTFPAFITVSETPIAGFTYSANQTTVTFTSTSQNGVNYAWDFGDNTTSTDENPTHTYAAGGSYTVSLSVSNNCGTAIYEETVVITSGTSEATWVSGFQLYPNPSTGVFTVSLEGAPQSEVAFTLFNALGQQVKRDVSEFNTGRLERTFEYGQLAAGFYTLRVEANGEAMYVKVTVSK
jgi:PKD repeat protein